MAKGNFPACLDVTLTHEGGWSDHPSDPGGATMKGVTIGRYREYYPGATKSDLRAISNADLERIYKRSYWDVVRGDNLPYGVDLAVFDFGVNSGPSRAARYLQSVVGTSRDGVVGPVTLKETILADGKAVIQKLCAKRGSFYQAIKTFPVFGRGWMLRLADVEAKSVVMWMTKGAALTQAQREALAAEASKANGKAAAQNTGAGGAGVGGGAVIASDPNWMLIAGIVFVVAIVAGALILKAKRNKERAEAYAQVAAG